MKFRQLELHCIVFSDSGAAGGGVSGKMVLVPPTEGLDIGFSVCSLAVDSYRHCLAFTLEMGNFGNLLRE